jgi:hypothetical protein
LEGRFCGIVIKFLGVNNGGSVVLTHESDKDLLIDKFDDVVIDCGRK